MSTTSEPGLPGPEPRAAGALNTPLPAEREEFLAAVVETLRSLAGRGLPFDEAAARERSARAYDRAKGPYPAGFIRQFVAVLASGSRREALAGVHVPTLVIHGDDDPLIPVDAGRATAAAIPGAKLLLIPGMGHDLPRQAWPQMIDAIAGHIARSAAAT